MHRLAECERTGARAPLNQQQAAARPAFDYRLPLIPGLVAQHGRWQRDKIAIAFGPERLTWAEFDAATTRIANGLLAQGLAPGDRIALLMENGVEMVEVIFGAMKAGVCVVPLNLSVSDGAAAAMIHDSGARALAATLNECVRFDAIAKSSLPDFGGFKLGVGPPDGSWADYSSWRDRQSAIAPSVALDPDGECNIIYSSGTTSQPKGIVHSHRCRYDTAFDLAVALRYHSGAVVLSSLGLYSNISWVAMLCTALTGATLTVMPQFSAAALADHIEQHRVTHGVFVPVQLQRLLALEGVENRDFGSLETIMVCGSPLAPPIKKAARDLLGCELIELYGLTEGLITTLAPEDFDRKLASAGKPLPGVELKLIDERGEEVKPGESGEIVGASRFLMTGYHQRPEATAEATWTNVDGRRWLRTGDIGRLDEEGFLYIVDRKKDMILSGGQNIYPADIELVMCAHEGVGEVAVIGVPSEQWGETPFAVVVPRANAALDALALKQWTNARVGKQQRISGVALRTSLPRNANGKVLKRELRNEYGSAAR